MTLTKNICTILKKDGEKQADRQAGTHRERKREGNQSKPKQNRKKQKFDAHNSHVFSRNPSVGVDKGRKGERICRQRELLCLSLSPIVVADPTIASLALSLSFRSFRPSDFARKVHRRLLAVTCPPACPSGKNKLVVLRIRKNLYPIY
jgi:hypothetical protein